jgi:serine/threonine-protein kinase
MLEALAHAHAMKGKNGANLGILHRDLRHSNVLLGLDGSVKVSDFELGVASTHLRTPNGVCVGGRQGYFSYLAPEQTKDEEVDPRTDLFSVGVVLYELVTGRHLFSDKTEERLLARIAQGSYDLPIARYRPDLHSELASIIRTALAPDKADRFGSAASFLEALTSFLASVGVTPAREALRELMERLFGTEEEPE